MIWLIYILELQNKLHIIFMKLYSCKQVWEVIIINIYITIFSNFKRFLLIINSFWEMCK